jgi:hypothetical protein
MTFKIIAVRFLRTEGWQEWISRKLNCAQIVPVKVKYFQTIPNETKNSLKNWNRINYLKLRHFWIFINLVWKSPCRQFDSVPRHSEKQKTYCFQWVFLFLKTIVPINSPCYTKRLSIFKHRGLIEWNQSPNPSVILSEIHIHIAFVWLFQKIYKNLSARRNWDIV